MTKRTHQQQLAVRKAKRQAERDAERRRQRRNVAITVASVATVVVVIIGVFVVFGVGGSDQPAASNQPTAGPENKPSSIPSALAPAPKRAKPLAAEVTCTYK